MRPADVVNLLPDVPRWIEVRGALLSGRGAPVGPVTVDPPSFVVLRPDTGIAVIVGKPPAEDIRIAAAQATEILAMPEDVAWVRSGLPLWTGERATLHELPAGWSPPGDPGPGVRLITRDELSGLGHVPLELLDELWIADAAQSPIGAAFADAGAVSFCLAGSLTEGLWDVSVDTLESHRRRGFATRVALFMIDFYARLGKRPVWGSAASNPASAALAAKLGFVPVDELWVFTPDDAEHT
jgi:hypothetical protein